MTENEQTGIRESDNAYRDTETVITTRGSNQIQTPWNNSDLLAIAWKSAKFMASSALVPDLYQGKPENCLIALDIANRTGLQPLTVMQNLYVVKGKPSWSGQMCISLVNGCGRFRDALEFVFAGEAGTPDFGCFARAYRRTNGAECVGDTVTMRTAKDEGWLDKPGSKWKTMPRQMMMYRAGAFFARVYCPDVLIGLPLADEVKDTFGCDDAEKQKVKITL